MRVVACLALVLIAACHPQSASERRQRTRLLLTELSAQLERSVEAEKSATISVDDAESHAFAQESAQASVAFEKARVELRDAVGLPSAEVAHAFDEVDRRWMAVQAVDAELLPLAEANTNVKASKRSAGEATRHLDAFLAAAQALESSLKPPELTALFAAERDGLKVQTLHAPHIASSDDAEMTALEAQIAAHQSDVDAELKRLAAHPPPHSDALRASLTEAWNAHRADTAAIIAWSRQNTNVRSFEISVHAKRQATRALETALAALSDALLKEDGRASR